MELDEIRNLIELLQNTDITELHIEREGAKLKIKREKYFPSFESARSVVKPAVEEITVAKESPVEEPKFITITSPIVGIFHRAPSPEAPPFVEVGSSVKKGQVLCIIEAMKLMNELQIEKRGRIEKILVKNAQPIEKGQKLFLVKES